MSSIGQLALWQHKHLHQRHEARNQHFLHLIQPTQFDWHWVRDHRVGRTPLLRLNRGRRTPHASTSRTHLLTRVQFTAVVTRRRRVLGQRGELGAKVGVGVEERLFTPQLACQNSRMSRLASHTRGLCCLPRCLLTSTGRLHDRSALLLHPVGSLQFSQADGVGVTLQLRCTVWNPRHALNHVPVQPNRPHACTLRPLLHHVGNVAQRTSRGRRRGRNRQSRQNRGRRQKKGVLRALGGPQACNTAGSTDRYTVNHTICYRGEVVHSTGCTEAVWVPRNIPRARSTHRPPVHYRHRHNGGTGP